MNLAEIAPGVASVLSRPEWRYFPYKPSTKQMAFLLSPSFETFYGGAAGGGKTDAQLMRAILYADSPGYEAAIFRKTCPELTGSSGLVDRSKAWLLGKGPTWNESKMHWRFPGGGKIIFGYCERDDDARAYQGHEWQYLGIDEVTTWDQWPVDFLRSRVRRTKTAGVPLGMGLTGNPGGVGHQWVRERYIDEVTRSSEVTTIRATISDNPGLDREEYERTLAELPPVLREQLMRGDWEVVEAGCLIGREYLPVIEIPERGDGTLGFPRGWRRVRYWDRAASKDAGCYTVGVRMAKDYEGGVVVEDVIRGQWSGGDVDGIIHEAAKLDNSDGYSVATDWETEPGSAGITLSQHLKRRMFGLETYGTPSTGAKWIRAQPFASHARAGRFKIAKGKWNRAFIDELTTATPDMKGLVDQVDGVSGAFNWLRIHGHAGQATIIKAPKDQPKPYRDGYVPANPFG